jgi:hypothetical protein
MNKNIEIGRYTKLIKIILGMNLNLKRTAGNKRRLSDLFLKKI